MIGPGERKGRKNDPSLRRRSEREGFKRPESVERSPGADLQVLRTRKGRWPGSGQYQGKRREIQPLLLPRKQKAGQDPLQLIKGHKVEFMRKKRGGRYPFPEKRKYLSFGYLGCQFVVKPDFRDLFRMRGTDGRSAIGAFDLFIPLIF